MNPVQLNPWASSVLVIFYIVLAIILLCLVGFLAWCISKMNALLEEYRAKIDPLLEKADRVLTVTGDKVNSIGGKAETILTQGEEVATSVHERVDRTAAVVQRTVNAPLIGINSLAAGMTRAWETFARLQSQGDGAKLPGALPPIQVPIVVPAMRTDSSTDKDRTEAVSGLLGKEI
jgi:hypothetical protein